MRLWLIRHGETEWNRERRCQGTSDLDLNEFGRGQARAVALYMKNINLNAVHSSPLKRAYQTAIAFAEPAGLTINLETGLMELNQGDFEGAVMDDISKTHPQLLREWIMKPAETVMPGGESMRQLEQRAWATIMKISSSYSHDAKIAVVSHNLALTTIICKTLALDLNLFRRIRISPASISIVEFSQLGPVLVSMNNTSHLEITRP